MQKIFTERLNELISRCRFKNKEVAKAIDVSESYISSLRNGRADNPRRHVVSALAAFFQVPPDYFGVEAAEDGDGGALREEPAAYGEASEPTDCAKLRAIFRALRGADSADLRVVLCDSGLIILERLCKKPHSQTL